MNPITCAPDCDWFQYDVWGEHDDGSLEGSGDGEQQALAQGHGSEPHQGGRSVKRPASGVLLNAS